ncbi:MAG: class I SAM-dependent methyltransferase, partial [Pseudomonadota bacterium]
MKDAWEDQISLNSFDDKGFEVEPPASTHADMALNVPVMDDFMSPADVLSLAERDQSPIPSTSDREGYYGPNHLSYWASGLRDRLYLEKLAADHGVALRRVLDIGCASGRVIRHFGYGGLATEPEAIYGCDINARHIRWIQENLPQALIPFQTTSVPHIPLPADELDLVTAFSVFSHIEAFESSWLMEIRRVLKPGGLLYCTIQSDHTWSAMKEGWPAYNAASRHPNFEKEREDMPMSR